MDSKTRKEKLQEIKGNPDKIEIRGARIRYKGETTQMNVYKIPLEFLIYNKYNGRIGSAVKSFERQYYKLNPEKPEDKKIIEKFLEKSNPDRNKNTKDSLLKDRQQVHGIVTADGVIIDGNRRAYLLNELFTKRNELGLAFERVQHCENFLAIILPGDATERDIQQLETIYQMGEDAKLDYNPIEKYLKCKDLKSVGFSEKDISGFMGETEGQIKKWLSILDLMEDYLEELDYQGIYTRLEMTEGPFVDLNGYLDAYKKRSIAALKATDWAYEDSDISDLKLVSFDYIRARYEGKEFREIGRTGASGSIFSSEKLWKAFFTDHIEKIPKDEKTVAELREKEKEADLSDILERRDADWAQNVKGLLEGNLKKYSSKLDDLRYSREPLKLLEKAKDILESIDTNISEFKENPLILKVVKEINTTIWGMKKLLDRSNRNE